MTTVTPARLEIDEQFDAVTVVAVAGEIDLLVEPVLQDVFGAALDRTRPVLVDICDCSFMDSTGLDAMLRAERALSARRLGFAVACDPQGQPRALIDMAVGRVLAVHDDRASGVAAVSTTS